MAERGRKQKINCPSCGKKAFRSVSAINRAKKDGLKIYCSRKCSAIGRRKDNPKTPRNPNWKMMKADYDRKRRKEKDKELKAKKKAAYAIWGPKHREEERQKRKERMPKHV